MKNTEESKNAINSNNNLNISYDENLNNLIKKILIDEFPINYKTCLKFTYIDRNKYSFGNKIFFGFIEDNDIILKEEININNKYTLNEFYQKFCLTEKKENKMNFIYIKKNKTKIYKNKK